MERWLIRLAGHPFDLEELANHFPDGDVRTFTKEGSFFLTGPHFDELQDSQSVLSAAEEIIEKITAVISLLKPSFRKPLVDAVFRERADGGQDVFVHLTSNLEMRSKVGTVVAGKPIEIGLATPTQAQQMLTHAHQNSHLDRALHLWAKQNRSWTHLYAILEEIEKHLGGRVDKRGLCSAAQRERFTRTANNAEAAGHDARHGSGNFQAPPHPMSLTDAAAFISELLRSQLQSQNSRSGSSDADVGARPQQVSD